MMNKSMTMVAALACTLAATACGGTRLRTQGPLNARLDERGVSPPTLTLEAGSLLRFINEDGGPHQIYSNDCQELSSTLLRPGQTYVARVGSGPKVCHFQDLLAPPAGQYWGTVNVETAVDESSGV
jgi:hypothetical protein